MMHIVSLVSVRGKAFGADGFSPSTAEEASMVLQGPQYLLQSCPVGSMPMFVQCILHPGLRDPTCRGLGVDWIKAP